MSNKLVEALERLGRFFFIVLLANGPVVFFTAIAGGRADYTVVAAALVWATATIGLGYTFFSPVHGYNSWAVLHVRPERAIMAILVLLLVVVLIGLLVPLTGQVLDEVGVSWGEAGLVVLFGGLVIFETLGFGVLAFRYSYQVRGFLPSFGEGLLVGTALPAFFVLWWKGSEYLLGPYPTDGQRYWFFAVTVIAWVVGFAVAYTSLCLGVTSRNLCRQTA